MPPLRGSGRFYQLSDVHFRLTFAYENARFEEASWAAAPACSPEVADTAKAENGSHPDRSGLEQGLFPAPAPVTAKRLIPCLGNPAPRMVSPKCVETKAAFLALGSYKLPIRY